MRSCLFAYLLVPVMLASMNQESVRLQSILLEYRKAAARGERQSRYIIEILHKFGTHVPQDYPAAVRAIPKIGRGRSPRRAVPFGVPQDPIQAYLWYSLAASETAGGDREAAVRQRSQIENQMTRRQRQDARQLARAKGVAYRKGEPSVN